MKHFALLLDSGAVWEIPAGSLDEARSSLAEHNAKHRVGMLERARCSSNGDYINFPMVLPRLATGLIVRNRTIAARQLGSAGGKARAEKLSPARRKEIAVKAARKRWTA